MKNTSFKVKNTAIKKYIEQINSDKKPFVLTQHGKSAAVIMDAGKYQEMQDQLEFMRKVALGLEDVGKERVFSDKNVFKDIEKILSDKE